MAKKSIKEENSTNIEKQIKKVEVKSVDNVENEEQNTDSEVINEVFNGEVKDDVNTEELTTDKNEECVEQQNCVNINNNNEVKNDRYSFGYTWNGQIIYK